MTDITPLEAVERIISEGGDGYQAALALAMSAEGDMFSRRFLLGDLALLIKSAYGKNRISQFATAAGIARSTLAQYKSVSQFYPEETRYIYPNVGYAMYREAMRLKERAFSFLEDCSANSYTVEQAQIEVTKILGKPLPPIKLLDAEGCIQSVDLTNGLLVIALAPGVDGLQLEGLVNQTVNVKLYEVTED